MIKIIKYWIKKSTTDIFHFVVWLTLATLAFLQEGRVPLFNEFVSVVRFNIAERPF